MTCICFQEGHVLLPSIQSPPKETLYNHRERRKFDVYHDIATGFLVLLFRVSDLRAKMHFRLSSGIIFWVSNPLEVGSHEDGEHMARLK
ncbi:MAG: hypothetical protein CM1200mP14_27420 [Gammaproteobacteria bacterium]|nr:MAG: hypothetical protein CM1200mP14_27420 [Gammaproteobacteria bacterium]